MTDDPEPPRRRPTSAHLQYPTLPPLTASVEEWLSRSRPTNMTSDRLTDNTPKSLTDSWATLSVSDLHSEDGSRSERTDSGSLIDHTNPDDVASLDDRYSSDDVDGQAEESDHEEEGGADYGNDVRGAVSASQELPTLLPQGGAGIDDSNLTTKPAFPQSPDSIEFVEPEKWPEIEQVELKHTIRIFDGAAAAELKSRFPYSSPDSILMATIQQTMTRQSLDLDKPFRVLYIGQPEFRNIILDKIGDVLVSSSCADSETSSAESSRYHVVPTSFGAGAVPNFAELLPIHVQLVVDECVEATTGPPADRPNTLHLKFKNRPQCTSCWTGSEYCVSSSSEWTLPDVAIIFMSARDDAAAVRTQRLAHTFLQRHGVPAMVISEEPLWKMSGEIIPLNHNSLHMCLESRHPQTGETAVLRRYPIDLKTFESITPGQLNRNLTSLVTLYPKKMYKATVDTPMPLDTHSCDDLEKYPRNWAPPSYATRARELSPMFRVVTLTLVSVIALSIGYAAVKAIILLLAQWMAGSAVSNAFSPAVHRIQFTPTLTLQEAQPTSLSKRPSGDLRVLHVHDLEGSKTEEVAGLLVPVSSSRPDSFEVQVVGDCHVVIKPPNSFASSKRQPRFNVSVHRHNQVLPYELSQLFDGVYTLKLNREDAYGVVKVTIAAKSRPPLNQTTTVDFGTPWLKIENWRRAAQVISSKLVKDLHTAQTGLTEVYGRFLKDLNTGQTGLTEVYGRFLKDLYSGQTDLAELYGRFCTDVQVIVGSVVKRSHYLRCDAECRRDTRRVRDTVLSRSKQFSEVFTRTAMQQFRSTSPGPERLSEVFRTAMQQLQIASSRLGSHSVRVHREARELVSDTWDRLGKSTAKIDFCAMMDRVRDARFDALNRAQTRARVFMRRWSWGNPEEGGARDQFGR